MWMRGAPNHVYIIFMYKTIHVSRLIEQVLQWSPLLSSLSSGGIEVTVFSATSKTMVLRWTRVSGASSYKITVAPSASPNNHISYVTFGPNTVMGSVNSLSPNIMYKFTIEALDNSQVALSTAVLDSTTGERYTSVHTCTVWALNNTIFCGFIVVLYYFFQRLAVFYYMFSCCMRFSESTI